MNEVCGTEISMDLFDKLTLRKRYQNRIAFVDSKVRFDEIPVKPHGQIIGHLNYKITQMLGQDLATPTFMPVEDNGMSPPTMNANYQDVCLSAVRKKRPDASWAIRFNRLPDPPPPWIQLDADGVPTASLVLEVAVNNEGPAKFMNDCEAYFAANTSTTVWIGVKVWLAGRKYWVGWAHRSPMGVGAVIQSHMQWPPNHSTYTVPTNIVYQIPMATVFGAGVPIPEGVAATLDIETDQIREVILAARV